MKAFSLLFTLVLILSACSSPTATQAPKPEPKQSVTGTNSVTTSFSPPAPADQAKIEVSPTPSPQASVAEAAATPTATPEAKIISVGTMVSITGKTIPVETEANLKKWKLISEEDGIQGFQEVIEDDGHVAFRGATTIPTSITKIATVLSDDKMRKDWVDAFADAHVIRVVSPLDRTEYNHIKVSWPFHDRDFVYHAQVKAESTPQRSILLTMKSVEEPNEPVIDGLVRGEIVYSYYYLQEIVPGLSTKVVVEMSIDPKGAIPKWLVTLSQKKWPHNTLLNLKKLASREDLVVPAYIEEYFSQKELVNAKKGKAKRGKK